MKSENERVCVWGGVGRRGEVPGKHRVPGKWGDELRDEKGGEQKGTFGIGQRRKASVM